MRRSTHYCHTKLPYIAFFEGRCFVIVSYAEEIVQVN